MSDPQPLTDSQALGLLILGIFAVVAMAVACWGAYCSRKAQEEDDERVIAFCDRIIAAREKEKEHDGSQA